MRFDKNGNPVFDSVLSPESFAPRALCILPKRHVIPVIFVPGIMGRNPDGSPSRLMPVWELAKTLWYPAGQKDKDGIRCRRMRSSAGTRLPEATVPR